MRGRNPKRPPEKGDGASLQVQEIFATLQGEGPFAGWPAVFVRLGGCNLACSFCDTEFENFTAMPCPDILAEIQQKALSEGERVRNLVVITGGEPLRQNIQPLCEALLANGFRVQIETNGTIYRELPEGVDIICSPKAPDGRYFPIRPDLLPNIRAFKFIVSAEAGAYHTVAEVGQHAANIPVYVQPMDDYDAEKNAANTAHALALAQQYGYILSLQTHKILRIP
jgi:7-carboxy-7-deazaguanine synthase